MELKIPPPVVALITVALIWLCGTLFQALTFQVPGLKFVALLLTMSGILIEITSVYRFIREKTTINPLNPKKSQSLVTHGFYRFSRNPMYLGMLLLLSAFTLWLANPTGLIPLVGFIGYITQYQIKPEEKILSELFGQHYEDYRSKVSRWI